jgi:ribosomal protein S12 methylthiotransferase accessory factor
MGITRVANVTGLDRLGIPVVTVCRPNARSLAVSQGKGLDLDAAKASGVMESIEAYHAEHIDAALRCGSVRELTGSLPLANVGALPKSGADCFHDDLRLLWIEGRNWLDGAPRWVPLETVSADYTLPLPPGYGSFAASTNGLASGNTLHEAVAHGICEVVERDAVALWKLQGEQQRRASAVDSDTIDEPLCREILTRFEGAGVRVKVWDVTSDVGIAAFCCLAYGDDQDWADPEFGAGCHPAREIALLRALTEAAQARTTFISGSRDDLGSALYEPDVRYRRQAYCRALAAAHGPVRAFNQTPTLESDSLRVDVEWILSRLRAVAIEEVVVVDLTRTEFGLPVVRVVVPGLEGAYGHEQGDFVPGSRARAVMPFSTIATP